MLEVGDRVRLKTPEELGDEFNVYSPENKTIYISLLNRNLTIKSIYDPSPDYYDLSYDGLDVPFRVTEKRVIKVNEEISPQTEEEFQLLIF